MKIKKYLKENKKKVFFISIGILALLILLFGNFNFLWVTTSISTTASYENFNYQAGIGVYHSDLFQCEKLGVYRPSTHFYDNKQVYFFKYLGLFNPIMCDGDKLVK